MPWDAVVIVLCVASAPALVYGSVVAWRAGSHLISGALGKRRKQAGRCPRCKHPLHRIRQHGQRRLCPECGWNAPPDAAVTRLLGRVLASEPVRTADHQLISDTSTSSPSPSTRSSQA
jgi:hypothetical protein